MSRAYADNTAAFRQRLSMSAALAALLVGALMLAGCDQQHPTARQEKDKPGQPLADATLPPAADTEAPEPKEADERFAGVAPPSPARARIIGGNTGYAPTPMPQPEVRDRYENTKPNPVKLAKDEPVSTFSADVDTASYAVVRRYLTDGTLPPRDAVRIEELVNYFDYHYELPQNRAQPFRPTVEVYPAPWNPGTEIVHIGIKGFDLPKTDRPAANLVFLLDVSGSMDEPNKLPLVKKAMHMLVNELGEKDRVSIVVYAGAAGTVLEPTSGADKAKINDAIDNLTPGGSTAGAEGIRQAYQLARQSLIKGGVNRVILATDGDFNVGITDPNQLENFVAHERETGITLTCLGFGLGNYNDALMQKLAQKGNGNAAYIDTLNEARKVLVDEIGGTLFMIAKDVKFQIEFNAMRVSEYRLIGYETRLLNREDFNNDKVDAGDIGAGHAVTALYEIVPVGSNAHLVDPLRYGQGAKPAPAAASGSNSGEIAFLRMRYKLPNEDQSRLIERPITDQDKLDDVARAPDDIRFAAAVAGFSQLLRGDPYLKNFGYKDVIALAGGAKGEDPFGYRTEFVQLARAAESLPALPTLQPPGGGEGGPP
jgi:Ca-activated chloride channel family protein